MQYKELMSFGDFIFPSNPSKISVSVKSNIKKNTVIDKEERAYLSSVSPIVVDGSGMFFGQDGEDFAKKLSFYSKMKKSFWLIAPSVYPFMAFLSDFLYELNTEKNAVSYTFSFIEDKKGEKDEYAFLYTVAKSGENAFSIANRCDKSVDDIMRFNNFKTPFDINEGDKVIINED